MNTEAESMNLPATVIVKNQAEADARIPGALANGPVHLRIEGMEGKIRLTTECDIPACGDHPLMVGYMVGPDDGKTILEKTRAEAMKKHILSVTVSGGETAVHPQWVRDLRDQCKAAGVAFSFESWGEHQPISMDGMDFGPLPHWSIVYDGESFTGWMEPDGQVYSLGVKGDTNRVGFVRVGRERSGRTLDGVVHDGKEAE